MRTYLRILDLTPDKQEEITSNWEIPASIDIENLYVNDLGQPVVKFDYEGWVSVGRPIVVDDFHNYSRKQK